MFRRSGRCGSATTASIHQNQNTVADQGVVNVSHGRINLSAQSAEAHFASAIYGDPVEVTGTSVQLPAVNGDIYDWALSWDQWRGPRRHLTVHRHRM